MKASTTLSFFFSLAAVSAQGTNCPAPGEKTSSGEIGCDPNVEYPNAEYPNEACALIGDCHFLRGLGFIAPTSTGTNTATITATSTSASSTTTCPPPGETNAAGDYSCNPAHSYPNQACALIGDCYFLRGLGLLVTNSTSVPVIISTKLPSNVTFTTARPTTVAPKPFTTTFVTTENGVPVTKVVVTSTGGAAEPTGVVVEPTNVATAGASQLSAVGGLAVFGFIFALL